jgi:hypothetical protein
VAVAAIANEIHEKVFPEPGAVFHSESHHTRACIGVLRVHVNDRNLEALGQIARVPR